MSTNTKLTQDVTRLIRLSEKGDEHALDALTELIYPELKRIAGSLLRKNAAPHTITPTALVHEVFIQHFLEEKSLSTKDRVHLLSTLARAMRWKLGKIARSKLTDKRGGGAFHVEFSGEEIGSTSSGVDFLILEELLEELEKTNERVFQVTQLKIFMGLENEEISKSLDISLSTVKRDWEFARAWLKRQMGAEKKVG